MKNELRDFFRRLPANLRSLLPYLIVTRLLQAVILFPIFWWITRNLLARQGSVSLNSSNLGRFLLSGPGVIFVLICALTLLLTLLLEVGGIIRLSAAHQANTKPVTYWKALSSIFRTLPALTGPGLAAITIFTLIILPLTGSTLNVSFLANFRIPNFITSVINSTPLYAAAYWTAIATFHLAAFFFIFIFHFMLLGGEKTSAAARGSVELVRRNFWRLLGFIAVANLFLFGALLGLIVILATPSWLITAIFSPGSTITTFMGAATLLCISLLLTTATFVAAPIQISLLTNRYYSFLHALPPQHPLSPLARRVPALPQATSAGLMDRLLRKRVLVGVIAATLVLGTAALFTAAARELTAAPNIATVGHRGGPGDSAIENTLEAIDQSVEAGAKYVEVDIQRTKDGHYIVFHDKTFSRFTTENRSPQDMTLTEIQTLDLGEKSGGKYKNVRVPTLEQLLSAAKDRVGIFLELKGASADQQMVDDAVAAVQRAGMEDDVVFMSLDYDIIEYIENSHPEVVSGFTYFLSLGDTPQLVGDYLILEEGAASRDLIAEIQAAGKKTAIWTVNTDQSMEKFANWPVDAVITDYVPQWNAAVERRRNQTPLEVLVAELME